MIPYLFYSSILLLSTLSAYIYETSDKKNLKRVFYFFAFFVPFIFIAIRYEMGIDYNSYVEFFYDIAHGNYFVAEPGYILLNATINYLGLDYQWVFAVMGFFTIWFFYKAFPKDGFALAVFIFIAIYYFDGTYKNIRQAFAVSVMAYATIFIYKKQPIKYLLFSILAFSFHFATGFVLSLMYLLHKIKINRFLMIFVLFVLLFLVQTHTIKPILFEIINLILPKYAGYLYTDYFGSPPQGAVGYIRLMIYLFLSMVIIYYKDKISTYYPSASIAILGLFFYICFYILKFDSQIFLRAQDIFVFYFIISLVYFVKFINRNSRVIVVYLLLFMLFVLYNSRVYQGDINDPYSQQLRPYRNIIFDKHIQ